MSPHTIAAIATATGQGAIGIVRVSGPLVTEIVRTIASYVPEPRYASLQTFRAADGTLIDNGLILYFRGPASFTGEDLAEFQVHGGRFVLAKLLQAAYSAGAHPARPGEFSERAFLNGKHDLLQIEAIADLISAGSERALNAALNALTGAFSSKINRIAEQIISLRATLEATLDFADDLIAEELSNDIFREITTLREAIKDLIKSAKSGAVFADGINTVILGRPNSGKSTLLNRLAGENRAIVSPHPGTTRDLLHVDIHLGGLLLSVKDTAGIHSPNNEIEQEGIRRALKAASSADLILYVNDLSAQEDELTSITEVLSTKRVIRIFNKIDLTDEPPSMTYDQGEFKVRLSAFTGSGIDHLEDAIFRTFEVADEPESAFLARERHLSALNRAFQALSFESFDFLVKTPELGAERLRLAHLALGEITGEFTSEDLLGAIFARFCIGK